MATAKPHVYRVPKTHAVASKLKAGEMMTAHMKMMPPDEGAADDADYAMEEQEAMPHAPAPAPKKKAKSPAEAVRMKRERPTT